MGCQHSGCLARPAKISTATYLGKAARIQSRYCHYCFWLQPELANVIWETMKKKKDSDFRWVNIKVVSDTRVEARRSLPLPCDTLRDLSIQPPCIVLRT